MSEQLMTIPLHQLQRSAANIRKTGATADLEELAASIAAHGLLQNLTVRPVGKDGKTPADKFEVVAGARRLSALKLLAKRKRVTKDFPVPCRVLGDGDAVEISLAENVVRAPVHPADQFEAFSKLHGEGLGIEDIAARFGVSAAVVRQRLKLAAVSPRLMEVYRAGDMTLDQLTAFTLTDDHGAQERVWFNGSSYDKYPDAIRRMLTRTLVEGSDRRARFVGADAYEAAGGQVIRDLFRPDDDGYFADSQLLDRLAAEKLAAEAERIKAEGWAWVEVVSELDYGYVAGFRRVPPTEPALTDEEEATLSQLCEQYDELVTELEDDPPDDVTAEIDRLTAEIEALSQREDKWSDDAKASAGVIVSLDYHGNLSVTKGLARPEESAPVDEPETTESRKERTKPKPSEPGGALSESLLEDLSAHRTAALRESLAARPDVAMKALLHTLVVRIFLAPTRETCVDVRPTVVDLKPFADSIGASKAVAAMAARHQQWLERLPEAEALWDWLVDQDDRTLSELLAYCIAVTANAVRTRHDYGVRQRLKQADVLAAATGLDMTDWWEPTRETYLSRVPKARIVDAVAEAVSKNAAANIERMKKTAMALRAEELLAGKRWLPEPLRVPKPVHTADGETRQPPVKSN